VFKKISVFLVLVLVIGALSACAGSMPKLSAEKKAELENGWYDWKTTVAHKYRWYGDEGIGRDGIRYYGNFSGYDIILRPTALTAMHGVTIGDVSITDGKIFDLYACKPGYLAELKQLYDEGGISEDTVAQIAEVHYSRQWPKASEETKTLFRMEMAKHYYSLTWSDKADRVYDARYYGNLEGYDILYVVVAVPPDCASYREYTIGEAKFEDDCSGNIYGYKDGILTFVTDLYNEGELSEEAISEIANVHQRYESKETK